MYVESMYVMCCSFGANFCVSATILTIIVIFYV